MVHFRFFYVCKFGVLFEGKSEVVDGLLIAFVVEIGFAHVVMGDYKSELGFAVCID